MKKDVEIPQLEEQSLLTSADITFGDPVPPLKRLEIFDPDSWENFTLQLVCYWKTQYESVVRCGGGGDMGRDVIAYSKSGQVWENFQCKHYSTKLNVSQALQEIGKLLYFSYEGHFFVPHKYYFVTPLGVSTNLLNHLMEPEKLKKALFDRWNECCKSKITSRRGEAIDLTASLRDFIEKIDFSIFEQIPPLKLIQLHEETPYHSQVFGRIPKRRPILENPPKDIREIESKYIEELLRAFGDKECNTVGQENLDRHPEYLDEFRRARKNFYAAEGLDKFSRDWLPDGSYQELLDECEESILPTIRMSHPDGYDRYLSVQSQASSTSYESHPLNNFIKIQDKKGMCHQLANFSRIKWVGKK